MSFKIGDRVRLIVDPADNLPIPNPDSRVGLEGTIIELDIDSLIGWAPYAFEPDGGRPMAVYDEEIELIETSQG